MKNSLVREQIRQQGIDEIDRDNTEIRSDAYEQENTSSRKIMNQTQAVSPGKKEEIDKQHTLQDEQFMLSEEDKNELRRIQRAKRASSLRKYFQIILAIASAYLVFLIYGALITNFTYDTYGNVVPLVVSVDNIRELNDFTTYKTQYVQARILYEKVLTYDYRLGLGIEDPLLIAPDYEKLLEDISSLSVQIGALTVSAKYTQPLTMLLSWVQNDIALYCQYMSRAITQNNISDANKATSYKEIMYNDFMQITQVIATLGSNVENAEITDIIEWTPEAYIQQLTGGSI